MNFDTSHFFFREPWLTMIRTTTTIGMYHKTMFHSNLIILICQSSSEANCKLIPFLFILSNEIAQHINCLNE